MRSVVELIAASGSLRTALRPVSKKAFFREAAMYACDHIDRQIASGVRRTSAASQLLERRDAVKKTLSEGGRSPGWDPEVKWEFFPTRGGHILLRLNAEAEETRLAMSRITGWKPYSYWNGSDPPASVSMRAWAQRKRDWDEVDSHSAEAAGGLSATLWSTYEAPDVRGSQREVLAHQQNFATRVRRTAKEMLQNKYFSDHAPAEHSAPHVWVHLLHEAIDWIGTPDGQRALTSEQARIATILPKRITRADMDFEDSPRSADSQA